MPAGHVPNGIERQQVASIWQNCFHVHPRAEDNSRLKFTGIDVDIKVMFLETAGVLKVCH